VVGGGLGVGGGGGGRCDNAWIFQSRQGAQVIVGKQGGSRARDGVIMGFIVLQVTLEYRAEVGWREKKNRAPAWGGSLGPLVVWGGCGGG